MKIYVAIVDDTHTDTFVKLFDTAEKAVEFAKQVAKEGAWKPEDIEEEKVADWLYYASYTSDSSVWVVEEEVQ